MSIKQSTKQSKSVKKQSKQSSSSDSSIKASKIRINDYPEIRIEQEDDDGIGVDSESSEQESSSSSSQESQTQKMSALRHHREERASRDTKSIKTDIKGARQNINYESSSKAESEVLPFYKGKPQKSDIHQAKSASK